MVCLLVDQKGWFGVPWPKNVSNGRRDYLACTFGVDYFSCQQTNGIPTII